MTIRIGISGWTYPPWRGVFFPNGLPHRRELEYASRKVASIEINGTFYSLQRPESYARWRDETPEGFVFSVKGPRFITHIRRLRDPRAPLANFFASGVLRLGRKLGPILWQLPPSFKYDKRRLEDFLALLPRTTCGCGTRSRCATPRSALPSSSCSFEITASRSSRRRARRLRVLRQRREGPRAVRRHVAREPSL